MTAARSLTTIELLRNRIRSGEFLWFPDVSFSALALPTQGDSSRGLCIAADPSESLPRVTWPLTPETVAFTTFRADAVPSDPDRLSGFQGLMPCRRSSR